MKNLLSRCVSGTHILPVQWLSIAIRPSHTYILYNVICTHTRHIHTYTHTSDIHSHLHTHIHTSILNLVSLVLQRALTVSDSRCDELETRNSLLEAQVSDLQERLNDQSGADQQIMTMISSKAKEWEVHVLFTYSM